MKKIILFLIVSFFCQCQQRHNYILSKEDTKPALTELQKKIDIKGNFINIFFESYFDNEKVSLQCDSKEIFNKSITTDNTINLADYYLQKLSCEKLTANIRNQKILLKKKDILNYKYLYISKKNDSVSLVLSNAPRTYY
ncbi:hypothetical protein NZD88_17190 [Chryseobacterium antibioticum]|uniref:Lipoprotein n=1 Tax=Chryseobacterium pyrolae TaxID=2987481 RepID=A0ABT2IKV4_9FLAO|nr:hypothetical protein [Chryseobacterium pyrolae]MCT2409287.1 hypothetical protein [Chryseobacterium pyrolae]